MRKPKLKNSDLIKIQNRFNDKVTEFSTKSVEELTELIKKKMSRTDLKALLQCYYKLKSPIISTDGNDKE